MKILLCTRAAPYAKQTLEMGYRIAAQVLGALDILLVSEEGQAVEAVQSLAEETADKLEAAGVAVSIHQERGRVSAKVLREVHEHPYDLVIIGSRGRRGISKLLFGSTALQITEQVPLPVLVVKGRLRQNNKYLVCTSTGPVSERAVRFSARLAKQMGATVHLLHVMSQVPLDARGTTLEELEESAEELIAHGSREGRHLQEMLGLLKQEGIEARALVRHGLVVDEIIGEARKGRYEMIITGAHLTPGVPPSMVNDLAGQILLATKRPVLVVH
ncbi:MAG: universal stress protein [Anaerolineales bacterium]